MADVDYNLAICLIKYNHIYKETLSSPRVCFQDMEDLREGWRYGRSVEELSLPAFLGHPTAEGRLYS